MIRFFGYVGTNWCHFLGRLQLAVSLSLSSPFAARHPPLGHAHRARRRHSVIQCLARRRYTVSLFADVAVSNLPTFAHVSSAC